MFLILNFIYSYRLGDSFSHPPLLNNQSVQDILLLYFNNTQSLLLWRKVTIIQMNSKNWEDIILQSFIFFSTLIQQDIEGNQLA